MALSGGSLVISTTARAVGRLPGAGNTAANTIAAVTRTVSGGATGTTNFGAGSGYGDLICACEFSIAAGATLTLDLYTGAITASDLTDVFGDAAPFRKLRGLCVEVVDEGADATSGVRVGGASSNEWVGFFETAGDSLDIFPDGPPFAVGSPAGKAVGSTTKNLAIENLSTSAARVVRVTAGGSRFQSGELMGFFGILTYP
jgi:hypothetical protein